MMPRSRFLLSFLLLTATLAIGPLHAQQAQPGAATSTQPQASVYPPANETPEQRLNRLGVQEDPGPDPDPKKVYIRFGHDYVIEKYPKKGAAFDADRPGWVRPIAYLNIPAEIYQQNDEFIWVWLETPESQKRHIQDRLDAVPEVVASGISAGTEYTPEQVEMVKAIRPEFEVVTPPMSDKTLVFRESSDGLPTRGNWRNSMGVADMNEDGFLDLVIPAERGSVSSVPIIYLGDGQGHWKRWEAVRFAVPTNYGTVVTGDLNKDGHQDIVVAVHLFGIRAFLGDGKGQFADASNGLPSNFPTRRAVLSDIDRDGNLDIVAISEAATPNEQTPVKGTLLRAYLNDGKAGTWKEVDIADDKRQVGGDWLTAADLNGDKYPDFVGASVFFNSPDTIYMSTKKLAWKEIGRGWLPFYSMYWAMSAGKFYQSKTDQVAVSFGRAWPIAMDPRTVSAPKITQLIGIDLLSFDGKEPKRKPIVRWESRRAIWGMANADFDGDGKLDLVYWHPDPHEYVVLLGDGKGNFSRATLKGADLPKNTMYDIKVADVNGDSRPDLIAMFESGDRGGSVRVYLNEGVEGGTKK